MEMKQLNEGWEVEWDGKWYVNPMWNYHYNLGVVLFINETHILLIYVYGCILCITLINYNMLSKLWQDLFTLNSYNKLNRKQKRAPVIIFIMNEIKLFSKIEEG